MHFLFYDADIIIFILLLGKLNLKEVLSFAQGSLRIRGWTCFQTQRPRLDWCYPTFTVWEVRRGEEREDVLHPLLFLFLVFFFFLIFVWTWRWRVRVIVWNGEQLGRKGQDMKVKCRQGKVIKVMGRKKGNRNTLSFRPEYWNNIK